MDVWALQVLGLVEAKQNEIHAASVCMGRLRARKVIR